MSSEFINFEGVIFRKMDVTRASQITDNSFTVGMKDGTVLKVRGDEKHDIQTKHKILGMLLNGEQADQNLLDIRLPEWLFNVVTAIKDYEYRKITYGYDYRTRSLDNFTYELEEWYKNYKKKNKVEYND